MDIGKNIKHIRLWKQIPQKAISDSTGIPQGTLSKIEGGADVTWSKIEAIAEALCVSVQDLVSFEASTITFHLTGNKAKGVVINQNGDKNLLEIQMLKDEVAFLRKLVEKTVTQKNGEKQSTKRKATK
jgi:DNA-binding Xre family transcriptional regulator